MMSKAEYARHRGLTRARVTQLSNRGKLVIKDGKVDSDASDALLDSRPPRPLLRYITKPGGRRGGDAQQQDPDPSEKRLSYDKARTALTAYRAQLQKLELEEKQGSLISKEMVEKEAFNLGRKIRDAFLNIPSRIGPILAAETDRYKVQELLLHEIESVLEILAKEGME